MAEVFVAHREGVQGFRRRVALKMILPQLASDPDFATMFSDEARLAAQLEHPGIAQVFDFGEADGALYLAMEFVEGASVNRTLRAANLSSKPVPLAVVLHVGIAAARALAYAHHARSERGEPLEVVHRDVSPANILLGRRGEVKLVDFGIARCAESMHQTDQGMVRGKLGYMSPEQVRGDRIDGKSDVFTLATVLVEMALGEPLFGTGEDLVVLMRIRDGDLTVLESALSQSRIPGDLAAVLRRALSVEPRTRLEASHVADALESIAERRGLRGRGERETARLLHRLGLMASAPADLAAREPGARPTNHMRAVSSTRMPSALASSAETPSTHRAVEAGATELLASFALDAPTLYEIVSASGVVEGPIGYADLVQRIVVGELEPMASVRREGEVEGTAPELARYLTSRAYAAAPMGAGEHGLLAPGSLLGLAFRLAQERATALLELHHTPPHGRARTKRIFFVNGRPDFVTGTDKDEMLGAYLVRQKHCLPMELDMALAVLPRYEGRLGDALVGLGVMRPIAVARAIAAQVQERYLESFRWHTGTWRLLRDVRAGEESLPLTLPPFELLFNAASRAHVTETERVLQPHRERVLRRVPNAPFAAFGMPEGWSRALHDADGRTTLTQLLLRAPIRAGIEMEEAQRAFHLGLACELVIA
jgi:serine/threonine-protein kinase